MDEQDKKRGLYPRYHITKTSGKPVDSHAEYFVLRLDEEGGDPEHVQACRAAIITYAKRIKNTIPHLARDLMEKYDKWTTEPWPKIVDVERLDPPHKTDGIEDKYETQTTRDLKKALIANNKQLANEAADNPYEQAAKEWLKCCSCSRYGKPDECHECTQAYLKRIKQLINS